MCVVETIIRERLSRSRGKARRGPRGRQGGDHEATGGGSGGGGADGGGRTAGRGTRGSEAGDPRGFRVGTGPRVARGTPAHRSLRGLRPHRTDHFLEGGRGGSREGRYPSPRSGPADGSSVPERAGLRPHG